MTIPANEGQVDLTVTIIDDPADDWKDDGTDDETIELALEDPDRNLPTGWAINADNSTESLAIIDNDRAIFFEGSLPRTAEEGQHENFSPRASIRVSSRLPESVTIPLTVTGASTAFRLDALLFPTRPVSNGMLTFHPGRVNIRLRIVALEDDDTFNETVRVAIDKDNLPPTIGTTENNVWEVEIRDKDARTVSFGSNVSSVTEGGSAASVELRISPSLEEDVTIPIRRLSGDPGAYSLSASAPAGASVSIDENDDTVHNVRFVQSEDNNSVALSFTALEDDDDRFDDTVVFSINQDDLPEGYNASSGTWEVRITDNDKRVISFTDESFLPGEGKTVGEGDALTTQLRISDDLAENFSVPIIIAGDENAYSLTATAPASASVSNGMIHFIQSEDAGLVTLRFEAAEDSDNDNETITVAIDADKLPEDYIVGRNGSIEIEIIDDDERVVSFLYADSTPRGEDNLVSMSEGDKYGNFQLHISPPLDPGQEPAYIPLEITGDRDAYWIYSTSGPSLGEDNRAHFHFSQSQSAVLEFRARTDGDHDRDQVRIAIDGDNLPDGFYLGSNTFVDFDIHDYGQYIVEFVWLEEPDAIPDSGVLRIFPRVGDVINLRLRAPGLWRSLIPCTKQGNNNHLEVYSFIEFCSIGPTDTFYHTVLDDHPRGGGGLVGVTATVVSYRDRVYNYRITTKKSGFYSIWIQTPTDRAVTGDIRQVHLGIR